MAPLRRHIAPRPHARPHIHQMILRPFQRGLDGVLHGLVGRQARSQKLVYSIDIGTDRRSVAADYSPTNAPTRRQVILRQPAKRHAGNIRRNAGKRDMLFAVIQNQLVVNLVGKHHQIVLARQFGNLLELPPGVKRPGRIVGIDEHDAARLRRNLPSDILNIRLPRIVFVQVVQIERDLQLGENRRVERIVWARREHVLARIEQRGQAQIHSLAHTLRHEHTLHVADLLTRSFVANRYHGLFNPQRRRVAILAVPHRFMHRLNHVRRRCKIETQRVADVERENLVPVAGQLVRKDRHIANGVPHILQPLCSGNFEGRRSGHGFQPC